jgi:hypothetical protein
MLHQNVDVLQNLQSRENRSVGDIHSPHFPAARQQKYAALRLQPMPIASRQRYAASDESCAPVKKAYRTAVVAKLLGV